MNNGSRPRPQLVPSQQRSATIRPEVMGPIRLIAERTGQDPGEVMNELLQHAVGMAVGMSRLSFFGAVLTMPPGGAVMDASPPPVGPADPGEIDTRTSEERLAALRDIANGCPADERGEVAHVFLMDGVGRCVCGQMAAEPLPVGAGPGLPEDPQA